MRADKEIKKRKKEIIKLVESIDVKNADEVVASVEWEINQLRTLIYETYLDE